MALAERWKIVLKLKMRISALYNLKSNWAISCAAILHNP